MPANYLASTKMSVSISACNSVFTVVVQFVEVVDDVSEGRALLRVELPTVAHQTRKTVGTRRRNRQSL